MRGRLAADAWMDCATALKEHDETKIQGWKEEIDTHLVFAGLFSAILTAFNVEAYKLLDPQNQDSNSSSDDLLRLLLIAVAQANQLDIHSLAENASSIASLSSSGDDGLRQLNQWAPLINGLWFSSLICSLASASISLMVKQWLNQYSSGMTSVSPEVARLRQYRYDSLRKWKVAEVMMLLPILLQSALVLFLLGLILFLLPQNKGVATVAIVLVALLLSFVFLTAVLPTFMPDCSYQSPQAWGVFIIIQTLKKPARSVARFMMAYANQVATAHADGVLHRMRNRMAKRVVARLSKFANKPNTYSWKAREWILIDDKDTTLDQHMLLNADRTFLDDSFLRDVVQPCLKEMAPEAAAQCYYDIMENRADRVIHGIPYFDENRSIRPESLAILTDITLDTLENMKTRAHVPIEHSIRILRTLKPLLVQSLPLTYSHFCRALFSILNDRDTTVRHLAFAILYQQLSENPILAGQYSSSGCYDYGAIVAFIRDARTNGDIEYFLKACDLVFYLAALPSPSSTAAACAGTTDVRIYIRDTLAHLQDFFETPLWKNERRLLYPISRIPPHLVALEKRYPGILSNELVDVLGAVAAQATQLNDELQRDWEDKIIILETSLDELHALTQAAVGSSAASTRSLNEDRGQGGRRPSLMRTPLGSLDMYAHERGPGGSGSS
ncbi:hypothetical protein C8Q76DRAFT_186607 [Earliella scabrosa]|nr:hypothetical protein C8Q76DRAFT_186607 [Earliella scabrosa]